MILFVKIILFMEIVLEIFKVAMNLNLDLRIVWAPNSWTKSILNMLRVLVVRFVGIQGAADKFEKFETFRITVSAKKNATF
jgi:hypothetical protein